MTIVKEFPLARNGQGFFNKQFLDKKILKSFCPNRSNKLSV